MYIRNICSSAHHPGLYKQQNKKLLAITTSILDQYTGYPMDFVE